MKKILKINGNLYILLAERRASLKGKRCKRIDCLKKICKVLARMKRLFDDTIFQVFDCYYCSFFLFKKNAKSWIFGAILRGDFVRCNF